MDGNATDSTEVKLLKMRADALTHDLTEALAENRKLREETERTRLLEQVIRNANDGMMITEAGCIDGDGPKIVYVNEAFTRITGYSAEDVLGKTPRLLQGPKTDRAVLDTLRAALERGDMFRGELINYSKTGDEYWLDVSIMPLRNSYGTLTHFMAIERDVTERKKVEQELQEAKSKAEKAQKKAEDIAQLPLHSPDPLIRIDVETHKILFVNPAAFNRYADILKLGVEHPLLQGIIDTAHKAFNLQKAQTREVEVRGIIFQQVVAPNILGGEKTITVYSYDITRLKNIEQSLREESIKAEASSRAKSDFLANMSHELRTPMNGVLGMAGLLRDTTLNAEQREYVETIFQSGESLLFLLNDILDFSKIEAGELTLETIPFNLHTSLHQTVRLLDTLAEKKNISLDFSYGASVPMAIVGDPSRIRQIVTNLIGNALKFTEKGSVKLNVSSRRLPDGRAEFMFRIDDTGIGISEKNLDKIFNKFTQADESTARRFGGTGLGLTICKLLVELMGGTIGVESVLGKGSSFWFAVPFPLASTEEAARLQGEEHAEIKAGYCLLPDMAKKRIIVIDDHPVNLFFAKKLMARFGFTSVDVAEDGKTALEMIGRKSYDLIITDCQMPDMDGYEVSRIIRKSEEGRAGRTPIIAMTANAMVGDREKCLQAGMDDYVSKPINGPQLLDVMVKWLGATQAADKTMESVVTTPDGQAENTAPFTQPVGPAQTPAIPPVDVNHLAMFIGDDEEEKRMVYDMFFRSAEQSLLDMGAALEKNENVVWKKAAHKLKGAAANFGAAPLADLCRGAEEYFEDMPAHKIPRLQSITQAVADIRMFLS